MKVLVVLAIVGSLWGASALPKAPREEDCKATISSAIYQEDQIIVSIVPPVECSATKFTVRCDIDGKVIETDTLPGNALGLVPLDKPLLCESVTITIIAYNEDAEIGVSDPEILERPMPEITNLKIDQTSTELIITYDKIDEIYESEECAVTFNVIITETVPEAMRADIACDNGGCTLAVADLGLETCTKYTATVTSEANNLDASTEVADFTYQVKGVDLVEKIADELGIIFTPLLESDISENCKTNPEDVVQYKITEKSGECFKTTYTVFPVIGANEGRGTPLDVQANPTPVEDLSVQISSGNVVLKWNPPSEGESCNLVYKGDSEGAELFSDTHITTASFPIETLDIPFCSAKTVSVYAQIETTGDGLLTGAAANIEIPGGVGKVVNLACTHESNKVSCQWEAPENCDSEELEYNLTYYNGISVQNEKIKNVNHEYDMDCATASWFIVAPVFKGVSVGEISEFEVPACAKWYL